eukprot:8406441-Pyramimonas_sp.AAC.1
MMIRLALGIVILTVMRLRLRLRIVERMATTVVSAVLLVALVGLGTVVEIVKPIHGAPDDN